MLPLSDAGPEAAAKIRFVRRRAFAVFRAHGYRELLPSALDPAGQAAALGVTALPGPDGSELRTDPMAALARVYAAGADRGRFARCMMAGTVFDGEAAGRLHAAAYEVSAGVIFGTPGPAADAEVGALALALGGDPGLSQPELVVSTLGEPADLARYLGALGELGPLMCDRCQSSPDPLRFFGCDEEGCRALAAAAPSPREYVSTPALKHHEGLLATLEAAGVPARDEPRLAFGA
ncbi:MAG TPA: ATP phosphoribosyltransferase regulatory subunit, partial [Polyangia bacterium]